MTRSRLRLCNCCWEYFIFALILQCSFLSNEKTEWRFVFVENNLPIQCRQHQLVKMNKLTHKLNLYLMVLVSLTEKEKMKEISVIIVLEWKEFCTPLLNLPFLIVDARYLRILLPTCLLKTFILTSTKTTNDRRGLQAILRQ